MKQSRAARPSVDNTWKATVSHEPQFRPDTMPFGFGVFAQKQRRNKTKKVEAHIKQHGSISKEQIQEITGVKNPANCISMLRNKGYKIVTHKANRRASAVYVLSE
jgi:hypothetical protein